MRLMYMVPAAYEPNNLRLFLRPFNGEIQKIKANFSVQKIRKTRPF